MRTIAGKQLRDIDRTTMTEWAAGYQEVTIDLGTGDGRFVHDVARRHPERAAIGLDASRDGLRRSSRRAPANALFVVADALALPAELHGLATAATINFPWGSLLLGLVDGHSGLLDGLHAVGRASLALEVNLNAGALAEAGWSLEAGADEVVATLRRAGFTVGRPRPVDASQLRGMSTTWAKRLAFGRDPRAIQISAEA